MSSKPKKCCAFCIYHFHKNKKDHCSSVGREHTIYPDHLNNLLTYGNDCEDFIGRDFFNKEKREKERLVNYDN